MDKRKVLVCSLCLRASCWYGMFICEDAQSAGLKILTINELDKLGREHPDYWNDETMIEQYGDASREFRT
jgi:hypothetical protein